jgi:hypothetical protein
MLVIMVTLKQFLENALERLVNLPQDLPVLIRVLRKMGPITVTPKTIFAIISEIGRGQVPQIPSSQLRV